MHLADGFAEADRLRPLARGQRAHLFRIVREQVDRGAGVQRHVRPFQPDVLVVLLERDADVGERRRVVAAVERQRHADRAERGQAFLHLRDVGDAAVQHDLVAAVVHRHLHVAALLREVAVDLLRRQRADGKQRADRDLARLQQLVVDRVVLADAVGQFLRRARRVGAAGGQRRGFAGTVAEHDVGLDAERGQQLVHGHAADEHRFGTDVHRMQPVFELGAARGVDFAAGEHDVGARLPGGQAVQAAPEIQPVLHLVEAQRELGEHVRVLRAFAGEQERELALDAAIAVEHAAAAARTGGDLAFAHFLQGLVDAARQRGDVLGQDREAMLRGRILPRQRGGHFRQAPRRVAFEAGGQRFELRHERFGTVGGKHAQFHRPVGHAPRRHRGGGRLLEDGVRVDAAEAERIHRGAARLPRRHHPRRDAGVDVERGLVDAQFRVDLFAQGRRQRAVVQRQRHLDQAGDARGRDAVADHRLHRAQRLGPDRGAAFAEHRAERRDFGLVAERDAGAVRLDQVDRRRVHAGAGVGAADREGFAVVAGREQAGALAVAGMADAAQHRVHAVAVGDGVVEALEHDHAQAFAEQGAVAAGLERTHLAARAERAELGEAGVDVGGQRRVDAAGEHHPAAAGAQFVGRGGDREQRRGAGRVEHVVGAAQVEPVGDAPGHHVRDQAGRVVGVGRRQLLLHQRAHVAQRVLAQVRHRGAHQVHGLVEDDVVLDDGDLARVQVGAVAEHDAGFGMVRVRAQVAGVGQRVARDPQGEVLVGFAAGHRVGHDPELARIEAVQVLQVAAERGLDPPRLEVALRAPVLERFADRVHAFEDVVPERVQVRRLREDAGHADDRDRRAHVGDGGRLPGIGAIRPRHAMPPWPCRRSG